MIITPLNLWTQVCNYGDSDNTNDVTNTKDDSDGDDIDNTIKFGIWSGLQ